MHIKGFKRANNVVRSPSYNCWSIKQPCSKKAETGFGIIACSYADTVGVPVLFSSAYFKRLAAIRGEVGANKILQQFASNVSIIDFPGGAVDIDTPEDFEKLLDSSKIKRQLSYTFTGKTKYGVAWRMAAPSPITMLPPAWAHIISGFTYQPQSITANTLSIFITLPGFSRSS